MTIALGLLFTIDGVIGSQLKTPLGRLAVKIESSPLSEKEKKKLLNRTQEANELFKETFKRFGLTVIPVIPMGILGKSKENLIIYVSYLIPMLYSSIRILQTKKQLRTVKKRSEISK